MIRFRKTIAVGASLVALVSTIPAFAAEAAEEGATDNSGDIVVMARKREESAQSVPLALNVASEKDLVNRSVVTVNEVQSQVPALRFSQAALNPSGFYLAMRGLVVTDARLTSDAAIGLFIDGVYIPRVIGVGATEMWDAARVEVLKGPQGTLFGKNNTAGAINIFFNEPTDKTEGKVRIRAVTHEEFSGAAMVNLPMSDKAALRLAGQVIARSGWGTNTFTGTKLGKLNAQSIRGTLKLTPTDTFTAIFRADYLHADATSAPFKGGVFLGGNSLAEVRTALGLANDTAGNAAAVAAYTAYSTGDPNVTSMNVDPLSTTEGWGASLTLDFEASDQLSLKSITAVRSIHDNSAVDLDGSPFKIIEYPQHVTNSRQFSQELQANLSLAEDRVNLIFGGFYSSETGHEMSGQTTVGTLSAATGQTINNAQVLNRSIAGFAQANVKITDQLNFTGGVRYTKDHREAEMVNYNNLRCTSLAQAFSATFTMAQCTTGVLKADFSAWSWTASLDYKPMDGVMLFARADRGYRTGVIPMAGGASPNAALTSDQNKAFALSTFSTVNPEYALSFEVGFKADFLDRRARINASYYNVKYSDLQRGASGVLPGTTAVFNFIANVASARVQGFEADASFRPIDGLELGGAVSYLTPKYLGYTVGGVDLTSLPFIEVPNWTYSLNAAYTAQLDGASLRFGVDYGWQSKTTLSVSNSTTTNSSGQTVVGSIFPAIRPSNENLNARISLQLDSGLGIAVFGRNLTNDRYGTYPLGLTTSLGVQTIGGMNPPRTFGIELNAEF